MKLHMWNIEFECKFAYKLEGDAQLIWVERVTVVFNLTSYTGTQVQ